MMIHMSIIIRFQDLRVVLVVADLWEWWMKMKLMPKTLRWILG